MNRKLVPWRKREDSALARRGENPFEELQRQMNDLFDGFFDDSGWPRLPALRAGERHPDLLSPNVEVAESDEALEVTAELPGLDEKDIQVSLDENALTLRGEKREEREEKKKNYHLSERSYGSFQRVIPLPADVDPSKVKARFSKGVLKITMPKTEKSKAAGRSIPIESE
jgi:HSP20 family protein